MWFSDFKGSVAKALALAALLVLASVVMELAAGVCRMQTNPNSKE
jgi:hypothetical protein